MTSGAFERASADKKYEPKLAHGVLAHQTLDVSIVRLAEKVATERGNGFKPDSPPSVADGGGSLLKTVSGFLPHVLGTCGQHRAGGPVWPRGPGTMFFSEATAVTRTAVTRVCFAQDRPQPRTLPFLKF